MTEGQDRTGQGKEEEGKGKANKKYKKKQEQDKGVNEGQTKPDQKCVSGRQNRSGQNMEKEYKERQTKGTGRQELGRDVNGTDQTTQGQDRDRLEKGRRRRKGGDGRATPAVPPRRAGLRAAADTVENQWSVPHLLPPRRVGPGWNSGGVSGVARSEDGVPRGEGGVRRRGAKGVEGAAMEWSGEGRGWSGLGVRVKDVCGVRWSEGSGWRGGGSSDRMG